jgi:hypothetical protein
LRIIMPDGARKTPASFRTAEVGGDPAREGVVVVGRRNLGMESAVVEVEAESEVGRSSKSRVGAVGS